MRICPSRFWMFSGSALFWLLASYPVTAQITPDTTLPINSVVTTSDNNTSTITGGTTAGRNLFHSFTEFSVPTNGVAFFDIGNAVTIENIISRVTGRSPSNIDGIIGANGTANLFFINPNGIIFGPNASLNIGGSFIASTANSLRFAGTEFSATNPQTTPLLTMSVPTGLQFGQQPREIRNESRVPLIDFNTGESFMFPGGLQVRPGKTLALVGGNVSLVGGALAVEAGRIELGSVGTGLVNLNEEQGYSLEYSGVQNFQDIDLSAEAVVEASNGGSIQVRGKNINLRDAAQISSRTFDESRGSLTVEAAESVNLSGNGTRLTTNTEGTGSAGDLTLTTRTLTVKDGASIRTSNEQGSSGQAGNLKVTTTDAVELSGTTTEGLPSGLFAQVRQRATGNGGNLTVETGRLTIRDGAQINASTFGAGQAGNVRVTARNGIELVEVAKTPFNGQFASSGIYAQVEPTATGNAGAGNVEIETQRLTVLGGAKISTATFSTGNGGELTIKASDRITLSGASPLATADALDKNRSGIFVSAEEGATGKVGNLTIHTGLLTVENGAKISADNIGSSKETTESTIKVRQLLIRNGGQVRSGSFKGEGVGGTLSVKADESVSVIGKTIIGSGEVRSTLSAESAQQSSGKAGDLNITTRRLNVQDGAEVSVSGTDSGSAGNLTVTAKDILLNGGRLTAETKAGEGAIISLQNVDLLLLQNQSLISATASGDANGGNIEINAANGVVVAVPGQNQNNDIIARAERGQGGKIEITPAGIFGIEERRATQGNRTNDIDANSDFGLPGTVIINRPEVEPNEGLLELPTTVVDVSGLVDTGCAALAGAEGSTFFVTGRGGLPPSPDEPLSTDVLWSDTRISKTTAQRSQTVTTAPAAETNTRAIVPATGWVFKGKDEVTLISHASGTTSLGSTSAQCPKK